MTKSGFTVDGIIKLFLAVVGVVSLSALEAFFLAPRWLVITALVLLFLSAATQISYAVRKGEKRFLKYPMLFDGLLVVVAVVGIILALVGNPAAAWVLFGAVALGSLGIAVVFTTGENGPQFSD
ncbi:hypothetical protein [Brevibacterium renqingii]|uniref:hypothetical protein n=1 Tax=Brevibacterium renqingii TaxID=2776916 RepID=UPI001AE00BDE|nr:hypothetical protein [Brevibacterium renqingii]